jgi:DNA-binding MurR/RpiR family transcriptional regulator
MDVRERILAASPTYTPSERRVADVCLQSYPKIAFDTVARIARQADTSPPTVIRFATKAGFGGFTDLRQHVRASVEGDWTRALDRLDRREPPAGDWLTRGLTADVANLTSTYSSVASDQFNDLAALVADPARRVYLAGGEITHGLCLSAAALLGWIRDDVHVIGQSPAETPTQLSAIPPGSVMLAFHLRRLTREMRHVIESACAADADVTVATNSPTLPLPERVRRVIVLHMRGAGDVLDSYTAAASLLNSLAAAVAHLRRDALRDRFDRLEHTWRRMDVYLE